MKKTVNLLALILIVSLIAACEKDDDKKDTNIDESIFRKVDNVRVPAEWEPQAAVWMQWASPEQDVQMKPAFTEIIRAIKQHEPVKLIASSESVKKDAIEYLANRGVDQENITWYIHPTDNSWLRDNGPIYVTNGDKTWIQNWQFNGWGSGFGGDVDYYNDDKMPVAMAGFLNMEIEDRQAYILEKGNVEVNSKGVLLINWDCQNERNPKLTKEQHELILKNALGVTKIIWSYGHHSDDGTYGHIDGIARFVNDNTIAIPDYGTKVETIMAEACKKEGFTVDIYPGDPNWLVGNGFVVGMGADNNNELKAKLESYFPGRKIYLIDGGEIAKNGGGVHCVTNDQPLVK